ALAPGLALADACSINPEAFAAAEEKWRTSYPTPSDIDCASASLPGQVLLCQNADTDGILWRMAALSDSAYVYAYENATGRETLPQTPPRDEPYVAARDACTDEACLCSAMIDVTDSAL